MSGIVGSKFNIRGSGLVGSLGTDGQHMLSAGAGKTNVFETIAAAGGAWNKIKQIEASSSATINFVNGASDVVLDGTYQLYCIKIIQATSASVVVHFEMNFSDDTSSHSYDLVKTWSGTRQYMQETGAGAFAWNAQSSGQQSTGEVVITNELDDDADASASGEVWIYNPADTTSTTHFTSSIVNHSQTVVLGHEVVGYCNITGAVTAVQFKASSDEIDAGRFTLYGITT